jgi:hypothetical protein
MIMKVMSLYHQAGKRGYFPEPCQQPRHARPLVGALRKHQQNLFRTPAREMTSLAGTPHPRSLSNFSIAASNPSRSVARSPFANDNVTFPFAFRVAVMRVDGPKL